MIAPAILQGYLLEEAIAAMLGASGYRLIMDASPDEPELDIRGNGLVVRGRGAWHQADVLGEFWYVPAFSLPVRLFVEAKCREARVGLDVVRNAHGVLDDVNENHVVKRFGDAPKRRYQYTYTVFSTSGFSKDAQGYALAHQISLVDLSGPAFAPLRTLVKTLAKDIRTITADAGNDSVDVLMVRHLMRDTLGTADPGSAIDPPGDAELANALRPSVDAFARGLQRSMRTEFLLAFPSAPFMLTLAPEDPRAFLTYAREQPAHDVMIRRVATTSGLGNWEITPRSAPGAYRLSFGLPEQVEKWIVAVEEQEASRARQMKRTLLSEITVYRLDEDRPQLFQLRYTPRELQR
ncbi:hypothetical protein ACPA54_30935 [Uniformispora flossi]|uniref:hypothetical protein n=1 Tax=Uniformispora flossi TaxID=3390723 RepID=UPI003C2FCFAA